MQTVLIFLAVLSVLVLVHEAGHYIVARMFGVKAEEFGYGFPPRAIGFVKVNGKWKRVKGHDRGNYANTIWSLNWLPLGGFVRLKGEQGEGQGEADSFLSKNGWQKLAILAAGVGMNWLLAAVIFTGGFAIGVPSELVNLPDSAIVNDRRIEIVDILPGSAADEAGLEIGDRVTAINETVPKDASSTRALLTVAESETIAFHVTRDGRTMRVDTQPKFVEELGRPGFGVTLVDIGTVRFPIHLAAVEGVAVTAAYTKMIVFGFAALVRDLVVDRQVNGDISGPVGIAVLTGNVAGQGFWALMHFTALLSLNLAVINFLPIPALDGGRALFVLIESFRRKRNNPVFEAAIHQIGFVLLIVLILLVTVQDLRRYGGIIWKGLLGIVGLD